MTGRKYEYVKGLDGHFELALYVDTFEEVDAAFARAVRQGAAPVMEPATEPWVPIAGPEGGLIKMAPGTSPARPRICRESGPVRPPRHLGKTSKGGAAFRHSIQTL